MSSFSDVGNLMYLYRDTIEPDEAIEAPSFLIQAAAKTLVEAGGRNWVPVIVKEVSEDRYQVIGNSFIYAVTEAAGLEKIWCIIADDSPATTTLTKILARESIPKINLATATREEIRDGLQYLIGKSDQSLKGVTLSVATNRITEAPRHTWKNFDPIIKLKCGITKAKLDTLRQIFYLPPPTLTRDAENLASDSPSPSPSTSTSLESLTLKELKAIAKIKGIRSYSSLPKKELIERLNQTP